MRSGGANPLEPQPGPSTNSGTDAVDVFLGVDGDASEGTGTFTLALTVAP